MLRRRINHDWRYLSLAAIGLAGGYALLRWLGPVPSGHSWGLGLGIAGMLMMCGAQTLYTWRKLQRHHPPGALYYWLRAHIALGLLGGVCVLMHGGGRFAGIAGVAAAMTVVLLLSGFVGRYLYTGLDRHTQNWQLEHEHLQAKVSELNKRIGTHSAEFETFFRELDEQANPARGWRLLLTRLWSPWWQTRRIRRSIARNQHFPAHLRHDLNNLFQSRYSLRLEWESLLALRQFFSWWYVAHIPLSWVTMTLAFVHIFGVWRYWVR